MKRSLLILLYLIPLPFKVATSNSEISIIEDNIDTPILEVMDLDDILLDSCINHLKSYEGFREHIYKDNDGTPTIGYGHHISKEEVFETSITEQEATKILIKDFKKKLKWVNKNHKLEKNKSYAIALFCFNIGEGKFRRSTLRKLILKDEPIESEIVKWKWFRHKGNLKENKKLKERRLFELNMYTNE
jgi:lysozyme